jgi:hypothetical protein
MLTTNCSEHMSLNEIQERQGASIIRIQTNQRLKSSCLSIRAISLPETPSSQRT